jgi:hypothetical protein
VDAANFPGSYYCQLKLLDVNRIKLDAIFRPQSAPRCHCIPKVERRWLLPLRAVMAEPTNGSHAGTIHGERGWGRVCSLPHHQRSPE